MSAATDIMIDLETLSTAPNAAILSIGAVAFRLGEPDWRPAEADTFFYSNIDLDSCLRAGLRVDDRTFRWWLDQGDKARAALSLPEPRSLPDALTRFACWVALAAGATNTIAPYSVRLWSHGENFDIPILDFAFHATHNSSWRPWRYNAARDTRTLFHAAGYDWDKRFRELIGDRGHNALADAEAQVRVVQEAWEKLQEAQA